jgi:hypothetical protein
MDSIQVRSIVSLGLMGMQESVTLAGSALMIDSELSRGTITHATFPLKVAICLVQQKRRGSL